jgi:hypothetical protein
MSVLEMYAIVDEALLQLSGCPLIYATVLPN